jgi:hypothetical protein
MKYFLFFLGTLLSLVLGVLYAGALGYALFGAMMTFTLFIFRRLSKKSSSKKFILMTFFGAAALGYALILCAGLTGAKPEVERKLALIEEELKSKNFKPYWVIISQKRNKLFNGILKKAVSNSNHLDGIAIDIFVFDINGDFSFNEKDYEIIYSAIKTVEKKHPELKGALGSYTRKENGFLTKHMIHIDTGGISYCYNL